MMYDAIYNIPSAIGEFTRERDLIGPLPNGELRRSRVRTKRSYRRKELLPPVETGTLENR